MHTPLSECCRVELRKEYLGNVLVAVFSVATSSCECIQQTNQTRVGVDVALYSAVLLPYKLYALPSEATPVWRPTTLQLSRSQEVASSIRSDPVYGSLGRSYSNTQLYIVEQAQAALRREEDEHLEVRFRALCEVRGPGQMPALSISPIQHDLVEHQLGLDIRMSPYS